MLKEQENRAQIFWVCDVEDKVSSYQVNDRIFNTVTFKKYFLFTANKYLAVHIPRNPCNHQIWCRLLYFGNSLINIYIASLQENNQQYKLCFQHKENKCTCIELILATV